MKKHKQTERAVLVGNGYGYGYGYGYGSSDNTADLVQIEKENKIQ